MAWWSNGRAAIAAVIVLLFAGATAAMLLRRRARRRHAHWEHWRRDHARRLPWELFRRRGTTLRLTDARTPPDAGSRPAPTGPRRPMA